MEIKKAIFSDKPELVANEGAEVRINFDIEEKTVTNETNNSEEEQETTTMYEAYVVRVAHPVTRDRVVDAIITTAYPNDVMQAIINNHLMEADSAEHEAEFTAMQQWRTHAKEIASEVIAFMHPSAAE